MEETKVSKELWQERMNNLINRRSTGIGDHYYSPSKVTDYESHFKNCRLGKSVLDVGCGDMFVGKHCPGGYTGIDAFPVEGAIKAEIETYNPERTFETVVAFQVLDGVYDLGKAISNMKNLCERNIILMVRYGIPADEFHTFEISESMIYNLMESEPKFILTYKEELSPKIFLVEYTNEKHRFPIPNI